MYYHECNSNKTISLPDLLYNAMMPSAAPIKIDPDIQGGTPCFAGTRVPVKSLFDYLAHGHPLDYFLEQFPTVHRDQATQVLERACQLVSSPAPESRVA
jgi:uncharacterized protein (DUF433 family)